METNKVFSVIVLLLAFAFASHFATGYIFGQKKGYGADKYFESKVVTKLVEAAIDGNLKTIDQLIADGADVNYRGKDNMTPLYAMMGFDNLAGFERLLQHGADPNVQINNEFSVIDAAAQAVNPEYLRLALKYGGDPNLENKIRQRSVIFSAIRPSGEAQLNMLIAAGADLNFQTRTGSTPLHKAAGLNQFQQVYRLLEAGADYTIKNKPGYTFVNRLENNNIDSKSDGYQWREKVIKFMRDKGVEVNPRIS